MHMCAFNKGSLNQASQARWNRYVLYRYGVLDVPLPRNDPRLYAHRYNQIIKFLMLTIAAAGEVLVTGGNCIPPRKLPPKRVRAVDLSLSQGPPALRPPPPSPRPGAVQRVPGMYVNGTHPADRD